MDISDLKRHVGQLRAQVSPYSTKKTKMFSNIDIDVDILLTRFYITIPVVVFIVLVLFRPGFLYEERIDKDGNNQLTFCFKSLLTYWLLFSTLLVVGVYAYKYKQSN